MKELNRLAILQDLVWAVSFRARTTPIIDLPLPCMLLSYSMNSTGITPLATSVLSVRLSDEERRLLEAASSQARTSLSEFVRRKALDAAEGDVLERRIITIAAADWEKFEAWAAKPARSIAGIKKLTAKPPTWQR